MPLVSVIMPSYNHESYLEAAINSVLNQTMEDLELIIIDDASQDNSREILEKFKEKDDRIHLEIHDHNLGISATLNQGLEIARGDFISLIASDDVWYEHKLETQLKILEENKNLIIWSEGEIIDAEGHKTGERFTQIFEVNEKSGNIFEALQRGNFIFGSSLILHKDIIGDIKFDENLKFLSDHKFYLDLAFNYEFYFIIEPLVQYRIHGSNTSFTHLEAWYKDHLLLSQYLSMRYHTECKISKKNLFKFTCMNPLHHGLHRDPWNRANIIYALVLPFWYLYCIIKVKIAPDYIIDQDY